MSTTIVKQINAELENLQKELSRFKPTVNYLNDAKNNVENALQAVNNSERSFYTKVDELKNTYEAFIRLSDGVTEFINRIEQIDFPERLDSIELTVKETISFLEDTRETTLEELKRASEVITKADFDGKFKNLDTLIQNSTKSNQDLASKIQDQKLPERIERFEDTVSKKLVESYKEVERNTQKIAIDTANTIKELNLPIRIDKLDANIAGILSAVQSVQQRLDSLERNIGDRVRESSDKQLSTIRTLQEKTISRFEKTEALLGSLEKETAEP